jgi:hypothetical protein
LSSKTNQGIARMAEHAVEYATATGNDYAEHERTYGLVTKLTKVATAHLIVIMISLYIGGVAGSWKLCGFGIILSLVTGIAGMMTPKGTVVPAIVSGVVLLGLHFVFG